MNANEIYDEIRAWLVKNAPRSVAGFDDISAEEEWVAMGRFMRLAFKAGVDYGQAKASALSGMIHKGKDSE